VRAVAASGAPAEGGSGRSGGDSAAVARSVLDVLGRVEGAFDEAEVVSWCGASEVRRLGFTLAPAAPGRLPPACLLRSLLVLGAVARIIRISPVALAAPT
jgi:hypothetical protein